MRQIVLDTETTGLSWEKGNRIVEIGCIELINRRPSGRSYQQYINPAREMEPGAAEVTGLTLDFLADKPHFEAVTEDFLAFITGAELIIHNAEFDVGFLNYELGLLGSGYGPIDRYATVLDTLKMARELYPGQRNSLDALCKRLGVDNKHRQLHGALLDAELLVDVYLAMTSGQTGFGFSETSSASAEILSDVALDSGPTVVLYASTEERQAHQGRIERIAKKSGKTFFMD